MKTIIKYGYYSSLLLLVALIMITVASHGNTVYSSGPNNSALLWTDGFHETTNQGQTLTYRKTFDGPDSYNKTIAFRTIHARAKVFVNDKLIYSLNPATHTIFKTTGFVWNLVPVTSMKTGDSIKIVIDSIFNESVRPLICYYGDQSAIEHIIIKQSWAEYLITLVILTAGIVLLIYSHYVAGKQYIDNTMKALGLASLALGIWRFTEVPLNHILFSYPIMWGLLNHASLMLVPLPFALFMKSVYKESNEKLWNYYCIGNAFILLIQFLLQLFGIADLHQTLFLTHLCILTLVGIIGFVSMQEIVTHKLTTALKSHFFWVTFLLICTIINFITYIKSNYNSKIGATGYLIYIVVMGIDNMKHSRKIIDQAKENLVYKKLAYTDPLTELYNRAAFNRDLKDYDAKKDELSLFMFDVNNLKYCNDTYGHSSGDDYLLSAACTLRQVFEPDGRCYRIGGDEFCVLLPTDSENDIANKMQTFYKAVAKESLTNTKIPLSIATGYATYQKEIDTSLFDVLERADAKMYECKKEMKKERPFK